MRMSSALIRAGCLQALFACAALAQTTTSSEPQPFGDRWFEGTVGNAAVRMYVGDAGWPLTEGLWGIYFFEKSWEPIPLEGKWRRRNVFS